MAVALIATDIVDDRGIAVLALERPTDQGPESRRN